MAATPATDRKYAVYGEFAQGGMASVHYGRMIGQAGFTRTVAIKRLHAHFAKMSDFLTMFLDETRLAARVQHPNVVRTLDAASVEGEVLLVMEYVHGESVSNLLRAAAVCGTPCPVAVAASIVCGVLHGLHAAHEATNEAGEPLGIVHRDVSPQNILVGVDGVARVLDFGIAKARGRMYATQEDELRGKLRYMPPERLDGGFIDRRVDVYAAGLVLWELLAGRPLFEAVDPASMVVKILANEVVPPSAVAKAVPAALDAVVLCALARDPSGRFGTARKMAIAIEAAVALAGPVTVGEWVEEVAGAELAARARAVADVEAGRTEIDGSPATAKPPEPLLTVRMHPVAAPASSTHARAWRRRSLVAVAVVGLVSAALVAVRVAHRAGPSTVETSAPVRAVERSDDVAPGPSGLAVPSAVETSAASGAARTPEVSAATRASAPNASARGRASVRILPRVVPSTAPAPPTTGLTSDRHN